MFEEFYRIMFSFVTVSSVFNEKPFRTGGAVWLLVELFMFYNIIIMLFPFARPVPYVRTVSSIIYYISITGRSGVHYCVSCEVQRQVKVKKLNSDKSNGANTSGMADCKIAKKAKSTLLHKIKKDPTVGHLYP